jgi:hypothetical protein
MLDTKRIPGRMILLLIGIAALPLCAGAEPYEGYTLFSFVNSTHTYLVDMDNAPAHTWTHARRGGYSAYLLEDGDLMRPAESNGGLFGAAAAGLVQKCAPDGEVVWQFEYSSYEFRTHHDLEPMPNGNVLLVAWEVKTGAEAIQAGLDHYEEIWPDHIIEVQPTGPESGEIVWEWHAWDHLIQDHDPAMDNYGVVSEHPELLDINTYEPGGMGTGDWMHVNGISYNAQWDQIVFSSHTLDEIYVIDHSTTTEEAASHEGGNSGKGGDFLYRWGNPANYDTPGEHYFRVVHCSVWIPPGCPGAGHLLAFNNGSGAWASVVAEIIPPADELGNYFLEPGEAYGPLEPCWIYEAAGFYSNHLGGCQRLPNGNTMIAESTSGYLFEVDEDGELQWSFARGGDIPRVLRYGSSYPGLGPLGLLDPAVVGDPEPARLDLAVSSNPCNGTVSISYRVPAGDQVSLRVFDVLGQQAEILVDQMQAAGHRSILFDTNRLANGVYFYRLQVGDRVETRKLVLQR